MAMRRSIRAAVVIVSLVMTGSFVHGQSSSAADQIRQRITEFDRGGSARNALGMKDAVVWTGASSKPLTKESDKPDLVAPNRRNDVFKTTVQRIEVSQSADMAYEYSTFSVSYDDDRGHTEGTGALLRVWKKDGGTWKIAVQFQRPYGDIRPLLSQGR
jgi:ketosteroid isomerase-like protein